VLLAVARVCY